MKTCPECASENLFYSPNIGANGGDGPELLPKLGTLFSPARMHEVLCGDCGLMRFYASAEARENAIRKWTPINRR